MPSSKQDFLYPVKPTPSLGLPTGVTAKVQIIDTTSRIHAPVAAFMTPTIQGHQHLQAPAFSFLIEQPSSHRKILFDLGLRKDWQNLPPSITKQLAPPDWVCDVQQNVAEILQENGVDVAGGEIEAVVWSHWHFDHTGDVSTFPSSTKLIAGAGVRDTLLPGYPKNKDSPLLESDFTEREYQELDFQKDSTVNIGNFKGYDYFKDGSFYLLDAPGHAIGHLCGLARVTSTEEGDSEDTFIFMGADTAHHGGAIRPNAYLPLPNYIQPSPIATAYPSSCPGHIFEAFHPKKRGNEPYYQLNDQTPHDKGQADRSLEVMREFDAVDNVFVIIAHDDALLDPNVGIEWFPHGNLKDWKARDYACRVRWAFLKDFERAIKQ
jgi:glyoxylase-like metal-dependent hydrolase (beta-lactamase superfamily II)